MVKTLFEHTNSKLRETQLIAEMQRLVAVTSREQNCLDNRALADVEAAVFNSQKPELIALYGRLLTDIDINAEQTNKSVRPMRFTWLLQVRERVTALVANLLVFADRITAERRSERDRGGYQASQ